MWYIYRMEDYSAFKKQVLSLVTRWESWGYYTKWYKSENTQSDPTYMWNLKKLNSQKQRVNYEMPGPGGRENGETLIKEYKLPATRGINSGKPMYISITIINNRYCIIESCYESRSWIFSTHTHTGELCEMFSGLTNHFAVFISEYTCISNHYGIHLKLIIYQ